MGNTDLIVDLSGYRERTSAHIPEGTYTVVVDYLEPTESKKLNAQTGKPSPGYVVEMSVRGGEFDGSTLIDRLWLTEGSLFRVVNFLSALGIPTPKKRIAVPVSRIVGKTLLVTVEDGEPYKGNVKSEVRGFARVGKGTPPPPRGDSASDLDVPEAPDAETTEKAADTAPAEGVAAPEELDLDSLDL